MNDMTRLLQIKCLNVRKLAEGKAFVRIDFYDVNGKVYFGEITFFPTSGFGGFEPKEWDIKLGNWIKLFNKR